MRPIHSFDDQSSARIGAGLDRISIRGLTVATIVGVLPHERTIGQPLRIDLALFVDTRDAGLSDHLDDTANYGDVTERVAALVRETKDQLLERVAERVAELVLGIDRVEAVEVSITKLRPPIPEVVESTAVSIVRRRSIDEGVFERGHRVLVALGSNLGDRAEHLRLAVRSLPDVVAMSQVYETDPIGGPDGQGAFLNMVVELRTTLDPYAVLRRCRSIEAEALRQRVVHWGPRTLDVDIIVYDDVRIDDPILTLPHPRYRERRFVLAPLSELAPECCPPGWADELPPDGVYPRGALRLDVDAPPSP